ncbi:translocation/assembly module TamB domain-containing protein [Tenacibaculum sp. UWU-22]|uniref:translocation/assembly module TamB domain-containing protein n=1 Tax=Tenacibaculum sp. UWU-22 TaxID=3234187 RepID=UPI0034DB7A46
MLLLFLLLFLVSSLPVVQTKLAEVATSRLSKDYGVDLKVDKINLSFLGSVQLKDVEIRDHHKDTLIFVNHLNTSILNFKRILDNKVNLADVTLNGVYFKMKTYKGEKQDNLTLFIESFEDEKPRDSVTPFVLKTKNIYVNNLNFELLDENKQYPIQFSAANAGGLIQNFYLNGPNISADIRGLYFIDNRGLKITNLTTDFTYTKKQMLFANTTLKTNNTSNLKADIKFTYNREDFRDFSDKVKIKAHFKSSKLSLTDLNKLYRELKGNDLLFFKGDVDGTLNNFSANNINLQSKNGMRVIGDMHFLNALNNQRGFVYNGKLDKVTANYFQLKNLLPNLLGKTLPTDFKKLGNFTLSGLVKVTPVQMKATVSVSSKIGSINSDLHLTNIDNIDNAKYDGKVEFKKFDFGIFANDSILGKASLKADVQGSGFKIDNINTSVVGNISELEFKGYNYKNLEVNGQFQNKKFDGIINAKDENLKMNFEGLADLSSEISKFDFKADIAKIDLKKTNLFTRDSIAVFKGKIIVDAKGNTFDDMVGKAIFNDINYTNQKQAYIFKNFNVISTIKDSVKTITVDSKDIIEGELKGKFTFKELFKMSQNALGSVYTNYQPYLVRPNQFIDFNFTIYNQIVDVFFSKISIGSDTKIKGKIKSDDNSLRLTFSSPKINAYDNLLDTVVLRMDNKNPLYNTHLTAKRIHTKYYDLNKLNLLNRTVNDTLYFKSVFEGGIENKQSFNLDFFYTINNNQKSVIGIQKSTFNYQGFNWIINPKQDNQNKITFDLKQNEFIFNPFTLATVDEKQKIIFKGNINGSAYKDLQANFTNVNLKSFLPPIDNLNLEGNLNGVVDFSQKTGSYNPNAKLTINNFYINNQSQGDFTLEAEGNNSYKNYKVNLLLEKDNTKNIAVTGNVDFAQESPTLDVLGSFNNYEIEAFSPLGEDVLSNLRGRVTGDFSAKGLLINPDFEGMLHFEDAGLSFPYLNIDFDLKNNPDVTLKDQSFIIKNAILQDTKYNTQGTLKGSITHQNFTQWFLNLAINTDNLLVLDTKEQEEVQYYGTAFLNGGATIQGLTSNLTIDVAGKTNPNTVFVIPLSDIKTIDNYRLIHFNSEKRDSIKSVNIEKIKGLDLNINLDVTKDATAQVVIDKASGSELKGQGTGNLQIEINTRGKFNMYGDFEVDKGVYNFKYGGIINKPFTVEKGGTISWNGNPFDAELNITAVYRTKANPAKLLENIQTSRKIPVDLYTKITGGLFNSKQEFDISIPNADSTVSSELEFVLNDNDPNRKMRQFFSLLLTGSFFNEENLGSNASSGLAGTASDLIANVLTDVLNSGDGKIQLGLGYTQGDKSNLDYLIDNQVDVSLSTQLSNRVIINGKVGIPVGGNTQTSVAGDLKIEVLLNPQGNFRAVVFNRQNEIQYSPLEEEGYTQGLGLSYQVNFNKLSDLIRKIGVKNKKKDTVKSKIKDTILTPHKKLINYKNKNN